MLYNRIRDYYRDLLRAKNVASSFDSEASSEESDGDENDNERTERREERENRRYKTARGFKELKEMQLTKKVDWKSVDKVLLWMDRDMEYQAQVRRAYSGVDHTLTESAIPLAGEFDRSERAAGERQV